MDQGERGETGITGARGQRGRTSKSPWLSYGAAIAVAVFTFFTTQHALHRIDREGTERRSDTCRSFEAQHLQEVQRLKATYDYLQVLDAKQLRSPINRAVIKGLPQLEAEARSDQDLLGVYVPKYCDLPNTGLPEPDPAVPTRPPTLLKR